MSEDRDCTDRCGVLTCFNAPCKDNLGELPRGIDLLRHTVGASHCFAIEIGVDGDELTLPERSMKSAV